MKANSAIYKTKKVWSGEREKMFFGVYSEYGYSGKAWESSFFHFLKRPFNDSEYYNG